MTKGQLLKTLIKGSDKESGFLLQVKDLELPVEYAVAVWEKLSEEIKSTEKKEPEKKDEGKSHKKPLDEGKMLALRKAGWSYEKIADEMNCATQTVVNRIKDKE